MAPVYVCHGMSSRYLCVNAMYAMHVTVLDVRHVIAPVDTMCVRHVTVSRCAMSHTVLV